LYVHVCKRETLRGAYLFAKANDGAPGIDGVTFAAVEEGSIQEFLDQLHVGKILSAVDNLILLVATYEIQNLLGFGLVCSQWSRLRSFDSGNIALATP
jgi:hypothetical protein